MDLFQDIKFMKSPGQIFQKSLKLAKSAQVKFLLATLTLIVPLSLFQWLFEDDNLVDFLAFDEHHEDLFPSFFHTLYKFTCFICYYSFYSLSNSFITFHVASLYISHPISYKTTIFSLPGILAKNLVTSLYLSLLKFLNDTALYWALLLINHTVPTSKDFLWSIIYIAACISYYAVFYFLYLYITALWNLAGVVSVLEPNVWGWLAVKKTNQLLRERVCTALKVASLYRIAVFLLQLILYPFAVLRIYRIPITIKVLLVMLSLILLVGVNLIWLLVQNVLYYACKSSHNQDIDKEALRKIIFEDDGRSANGNPEV